MLFFLFLGCTAEKIPEIGIQVDTWCEASIGEVTGERHNLQDFAHAHMGRNLFGPTGNWLKSNDDLSTLLEGNTAINDAFLHAYAEQYSDVCSLEVSSASVGPSTVEMMDGMAHI